MPPLVNNLPTTQQQVILMRYLAGESGPEIAKAMGLTPGAVYNHLRNPIVKAAMAEKLRALDVQIMDFKIKAIEESHASLEKLINLRGMAKDERLQRDCANDIVRLAGLEPRKRIVVSGDILNGIDSDVLEFYDEVANEVKSLSE